MDINHKHQRGIALLEVLIAFFVLSIGLLGLAGLQIKTMQFNQSSYQRSQAMFAAYDMSDRMRLDREEVIEGSFNTDWTDGAAGDNADLKDWIETVKEGFPGGQGKVECDGNMVCTIGVRWVDRFNNSENGPEYEEINLISEL